MKGFADGLIYILFGCVHIMQMDNPQIYVHYIYQLVKHFKTCAFKSLIYMIQHCQANRNARSAPTLLKL